MISERHYGAIERSLTGHVAYNRVTRKILAEHFSEELVWEAAIARYPDQESVIEMMPASDTVLESISPALEAGGVVDLRDFDVILDIVVTVAEGRRYRVP